MNYLGYVAMLFTLPYYATRFNNNFVGHWQKIEVDGGIHECCSHYDEVVQLRTRKFDKPRG